MAGLYGLNVLIGGHPIKGCPLRVKVLADETLAKNCRCFGSGMSHAVAGEPTSFTIQVRRQSQQRNLLQLRMHAHSAERAGCTCTGTLPVSMAV
jgi:hypothetical protein